MDPLSAATPYRESVIALDTDLASVLQERGITLHRKGQHIARRAAQGMANKAEWTNVKFWASGCWSLEPLQVQMANLHESTIAASLIITGFTFIATLGPSSAQGIMQEMPNWAQSTITGASYSGSVPSSGDVFYRKRIPAPGSTDPGALVANAGFDSARPALPYPNTDIPMDRTGVSTATYAEDAGFFLRWRTFGNHMSPHRYLLTFHFGQYAIVLTGSGEAQLWEYAIPAGESPTPYYVQRDAWRFTQETHASAGHAHCMAIFPHVASDGNRYIAFSNLATGTAPKTNTGKKVDGGHSVTGEHVYRITAAVMGTDVDQSPGHATTSDHIRFDLRRDARPDVQFSQLGYLVDVNGVLLDDPILVPNGNFTGNASTINQNYGFVTPSGTACTGEILDAVTGATFVAGTDKYPRAKFTLTTSSATVTPTLWGYHHVQAPVHIAIAPGAFSLDPREVNIQGYAGDPQTELATVEAYDPGMVHTRLTKRGYFSSYIATIYTPNLSTPGTAVTVRMFQGYVISPQWEQVGTALQHPGGAGPGPTTLPTGTYIAPKFYKYSLNVVGMYQRLTEHVQPPYPELYANDPTAPQGTSGFDQTWKITDIIKDVLNRCGFDASFQNIPDLPYRIWPGYTESSSDLMIEPTTSLAEWLVRMIREHLGAYLCFEPNSGANGQWILIFGTQAAEDGTFASPLYNFTGDAAEVEGLANPLFIGSYAAVSGIPTAPIKHVSGSQNKPDFNQVTVSTGLPTTDSETPQAVEQVIFNPISYKVPTSTIDPDPDHPDYIGHCIPYELLAPQAVVGGDGASDIQATQENVDWLARRYYDFLCHGQKLTIIDVPLVFVQDETLSATTTSSSGNWRPLRFQDPVMLEGDPSWLVKSIRHYWTSDRNQRSVIELIQPFPGQHFIGHDELEKIKKAHRATIAKHAAMSHSTTHSGKTVAAHKHSGHHKLSVAGPISSIQNADGSFITFPAWFTKTQTDG